MCVLCCVGIYKCMCCECVYVCCCCCVFSSAFAFTFRHQKLARPMAQPILLVCLFTNHSVTQHADFAFRPLAHGMMCVLCDIKDFPVTIFTWRWALFFCTILTKLTVLGQILRVNYTNTLI